MYLLEKLKCKYLTFILDQFVKLEKPEVIALKLEIEKIMKNLKRRFFQTADYKDGFPLISKRKKILRNGDYCILIGFAKKDWEKSSASGRSMDPRRNSFVDYFFSSMFQKLRPPCKFFFFE